MSQQQDGNLSEVLRHKNYECKTDLIALRSKNNRSYDLLCVNPSSQAEMESGATVCMVHKMYLVIAIIHQIICEGL